MKKKHLPFIVSILTVTSLIVFFLVNNQKEKQAIDGLPTVTFRQGWFTYAGFAGEVYAMDNKIDSTYGINLIVEQGADDIDPIKLVLAGTSDFGISSAEAVLAANEKDAGLVIVGVVNYLSPTCFISLEKTNIKKPTDFEGKKVGILTGTETETVYRTLVRKLRLQSEKISEIEAPYDLKTFINGEFEVYPGFYYSEPVALDFQKIKYNIIKPSDYGVRLMGAVYFTTKKYLTKNPAQVEAFVYSIAKGWELSIANPSKSIEKLTKYDSNIDSARELSSLKKGIDYFKGENDNVLFVSRETIKEQLESLHYLKRISDTTDFTGFNLKYVESYHNSKNE